MTQKGLVTMSKILSKIFPIIDHLYIYQILEYNSWDFLKWFLKNPFKRNLQKKHQLEWTQKAKLLGFIGITLLILDSVITSYLLTGRFWLSLILLPIKSLYSPLFLIVAQILISPLEYYQKQKTITAAKKKLSKLPNLKIVAITGSFGKTSTKDILYTLLWKKHYVVKTPKSFNTPLGIAQTILEDIKENTEVFICEMGAYKIGEIKKIASLINPTIGIITAIAPQHLQKFGSLENIAKAKFELVENLSPNSVAILNNESDWLQKLASHSSSGNIIFYGDENNPFYASNIRTGIVGTTFQIHTPKGQTEINIPLIGEHHVQNFLAATAAALALGLTLFEIKERAKLLLPTPHRMEIKKMGNMILIDNSYNANPKSAESSLELLASFEDNRKIVITPGFVELGKEAAKANQEFGHEIRCLADEVIIVGENAKKDLLEGMKDIYSNPEEFVHFAKNTQEALVLAQELTQGVETAVLLENDLPDQYS